MIVAVVAAAQVEQSVAVVTSVAKLRSSAARLHPSVHLAAAAAAVVVAVAVFVV